MYLHLSIHLSIYLPIYLPTYPFIYLYIYLSTTIQIINGPSISISLKGAGTEPQVSFSFLEYDFGPRFLHHPNMPPNITTLVITNREKTELNIDCLYSNTPYMELHFESRLLVPGETIDIDCYFRPHEAMKYKEVIVFEINGIHRKAVTIKGEGALMKVTVDSLPMCMCVHMYMYVYVHA